jgi:hypothetical protein
MRESSVTVAPVHEYVGAPKKAASLFAVTKPFRADYMLVLLDKGSLIGSCDWTNSPDREGWTSFCGHLASLDISPS